MERFRITLQSGVVTANNIRAVAEFVELDDPPGESEGPRSYPVEDLEPTRVGTVVYHPDGKAAFVGTAGGSPDDPS